MFNKIIIGVILVVFIASVSCNNGNGNWERRFGGGICDEGTFQRSNTQKVLPSFPRRWHGSGVFVEIGNPNNRLMAEYFHDAEKGIGREFAKYVDKYQEIYFDFRPTETNELPATEIWIELNRTSGIDECYIPPFPIPNLFIREWWLRDTNLIYQGQCQVGGHLSDCWVGHYPQAQDVPILWCNLAERYPSFRPTVKQVFNFRFTEYWGEEQSEFSEEFMKPPAELVSSCRSV